MNPPPSFGYKNLYVRPMKGSILWLQSSSIQHLLRSRADMAFLRKSLLLVLFLGLVSLSICEDERE
ncbi:hypothetical protein GDO81_024797 [Engystomops pustulosus]|uniref:Frog antimicrobial peptide propeptide domain-containing protein n=1 Tax=Engystomops pustulosus TaxID=76066 RepID=A0AAV6YQ28_ENGPU|nr:hypothetical protein GDO81_024797 [Engystomops pustulosus]